MVSSFSHSRSTTRSNAAPSNTTHSTLVGIDTLAHLPGSVVLPPVYPDESFVSQRHEVNPAIALNLLSDIQTVVLEWQEQLRQLVKAMRVIHAQGPMVDGWLESCAETSQAPKHGAEMTLLRHGDTAALMQYVNALDTQAVDTSVISTQPQQQSAGSHAPGTADAATQYRLCSLDENGQLKSQPCPAEQMGIVSLAIARHQKFKQLLNQKQAIEAKLQKAVDQLTGVRGTLHHID